MTSTDSGAARDAEQQIIDRAMRDPDFRNRLLENPREAIQDELGIALATATIRVIEEQPGEVVLVLPAQTAESASSLSDQDLESVAGGTYTQPTGSTVCGTCSGMSTCSGGCPSP